LIDRFIEGKVGKRVRSYKFDYSDCSDLSQIADYADLPGREMAEIEF
jgi:hypothetical protein